MKSDTTLGWFFFFFFYLLCFGLVGSFFAIEHHHFRLFLCYVHYISQPLPLHVTKSLKESINTFSKSPDLGVVFILI